MPVVPYREPQVDQRPLGGVRQESVASPSLFSTGGERQLQSGKQLLSAGDELGKIAGDMQNRENADMIFRAETAIKTEYIGFEKQAREERRGDAAKNLTKDAADWWEKRATEHASNLGNPVQKELFSKQVAKLRTQSMDSLSSYEADQRRVALNESATASMTASVNLAASQVGTPTERAAIMGAKDDILKRLDVLAKINGYGGDSPEATALRDAKRAEALTNLHMQVIQNMVNADPSRAKAYFEANKSEINGSKFEAIENLYKIGDAKEKAQKTSDKLAAEGKGEAEGLAYIRQNLKGEEQAQAALEWKTRHAELTTARERSQKDAADEAYRIYARTGRISAIPADIVQKMDGKVWLLLTDHAEARAKRNSAEVMPKTDWNKYYALRQLAIDRPDAFATRDLRQDFGYLGQAARESMIDLQTKVKKPDEMKDAATLQTQLSATHNLMQWGGQQHQEKKGMFDIAVTTAIANEEKNLGKKLDQAQRQKIIDRMLIDGEVLSGAWYLPDPNKRFFEVYGKGEAAKFNPAVPKDERDKIKDALTRAGKPVDDATVLKLYKQKMGLP